MNTDNHEMLKRQIEDKIDAIAEYYNNNKGVILSETDLQCIMYQKLLEIEQLSKIEKTKNIENIKTHCVHTKISWSDNEGKFTLEPDISLINPLNLTIDYGIKDITAPTRGVYFNDGGIVFKLKFNQFESSVRFLDELKRDFVQFQRLYKLNNKIFCYFVVFNKTNYMHQELEEFLQKNIASDKHKIIYKTGNVKY